MSQKHEPLATTNGNIQARTDPLNMLDESTVKPAPTFAQESQQHRSLHSKLIKQERSGKQTGAYVSPSDDIMSPASAKLNALKDRRFAKSAAPRRLFAKTVSLSSQNDAEEKKSA